MLYGAGGSPFGPPSFLLPIAGGTHDRIPARQFSLLPKGFSIYGAGGIRTPGTLLGHNSLAGSPIRPLSHRSKGYIYSNVCPAPGKPLSIGSNPRTSVRCCFIGFACAHRYAGLTEQGGFEPPVPFGTTVFKTASLNRRRSDTAP